MQNGARERFENGARLFNDFQVPAQIKNRLALFRRDFASRKRRLQKPCAGFPHVLRKDLRPFCGNRARLDHQLSRAELGLDLIEDGLHRRRIIHDDEDDLRPVHSLLDGGGEVGQILRSPVPAPHRMTVGDQVFRPRAPDESHA